MSGVTEILYALFLVAAVTVATCANVDISLSSHIVLRGDDISVRCRVMDFQIGYILFWWKKQDGNPVEIGANNVVNDVVKKTGRYNIEIEQNHNDVIFVLKITGAQPEDSGEFGCSVRQFDGSDVYGSLTVVAPVESVRLFSMSPNSSTSQPVREYAQGDVVNFKEGDSYYFRCIAYGSNPSPDVVFYSGTTDITDFFDRDDRIELTGEVAAMKRVVHMTTLTSSKAVVADWKYSGQDLSCTASVVYTDPVNIYVTPEFKFRPKMTCPSVILTPALVEDFRLECKVRANPGIDEIVWSWQRIDGTEMTIKAWQKESYYSVIIEDGETADEKVIALVMEKIYPQMFRTYSLTVTSSLGRSNASTILAQRKDDKPEPSGATSLRVTSLLCVLYLLAFCSL